MDRPDAPEPASRRDRAGIAALYLAAVVVYAVLGHRMPVPMVSPDEYTYGHIAQSLAHGDGVSWRGNPVALRSILYMVAIAPSWVVGSTVSGYAIAKIVGAALVCSVVFPSWLLARRLVGPGLALLTAALVVAGPSLILAGEILTENLAYPLATWALIATVLALREPGSRWVWAALGFALLAAGARAQLIVLVPIVALAVLAEAARHGSGWRAAIAAHRTLLVAAGGLSAAGLLAVLVAGSTALGAYADLKLGSPLSEIAKDAGHQLVGLVTSAAIVPAIVVLAVSVRRAGWRDPALGPVLAVLWPATAVLVAESAVAAAGYGTAWHIERYVVYLLPLAFIVTVAALARGLLTWWSAAARDGRRRRRAAARAAGPGGRGGTLDLRRHPPRRRAARPVGSREPRPRRAARGRRGGWPPCGSAGAGERRTTRAALAGAAAGGADRAVRPGVDVEDRHRPRLARPSSRPTSRGPTTRRGRRSRAWSAPPTPRCSRSASSSTATPGRRSCPRRRSGAGSSAAAVACGTPAADGTLTFDAGCGAPPRRFYLDDYYAKFTFKDQRVELDRPPVARIVSVPGTPRLLAELFPLCGPPLPALASDGSRPTVGPRRRPCEAATLGGRFWLDRPATLALVWRGGVRDEQLTAGTRTYAIPAGRRTTIRLRVPAGAVGFGLQPSWTGGTPPQAPSLLAARLVDRAGTTDLLY